VESVKLCGQARPVPGGYRYGHLDLQVRGVSYETVKHGHESCGLHCPDIPPVCTPQIGHDVRGGDISKPTTDSDPPSQHNIGYKE
jgi:hypothetical protein